MSVFLKYISKNMFEKKGRFVLLLFSIAVSAALLVACTGMVDVIVDSFNAPYESGRLSDISIVSKTDDPYMKESDVDTSGLKDVVYELRTTGIINENDKIKYVNLRGRNNYSGSMAEGNADFLSEKTVEGNPSCILSKRVSDVMNLQTGDTLKLFISGEEISFTVEALAANDNVFYPDTSTNFSVIIPYEYLNEKLGADDGYNVVFADVADGEAKDFAESYNENHTDVNATDLKGNVMVDSSINMALYFMMTIVVIVSAIIIHGVFKLIMTERLSVMGTFMSQGATKKKIEHIILMEGFIYGLIGGIIGSALGEVFLYFLGRWTSPLGDYGVYTKFHINPVYILIGIIFSIILSVVSAYFPVRKVRKLEVKDVILNRAEPKRSSRLVKTIIGIILLAFSIAVYFINDSWINVTTPIAFITAFAGVILLVPMMMKLVTAVFGKLFKNNTTLYLTLSNIRSSKLLRNNIVLVVVSLSSVLMISSFGKSMTNLVVDAYKGMNYDYNISGIMEMDPNNPTTDRILDKLHEIKGIDQSSIGDVYYAEAEIDGELAIATGSEVDAYVNVLNEYFGFTTTYADEIQALKDADEYSILLTTKIADAIDKKAGDTVTMKINSHEVNVKVVGVYDGKVFQAGRAVLMKKELLINEFNIKEAAAIYFETEEDSSVIEKELKPFLASLGATYTTKAEDTKLNDEQNQTIVSVLSIFSYLAMIIASIGVFNNITICFLQRKREMAVMASVGMNKSRRKRMILTESMTCVIFSVLISIPFTILLSDLLTGFCKFIGMPMEVAFSWTSIMTYAPIITVIILIATLSTMRKSRKLSIVQELKYE